mmetsp:Transcript_88410/g.245442  ORF Transcript_88410/g.245442 Transcript_88410/m.245442 type:complete len:507 (-) Transcript_88410:98-1618(-)
MAPSLLRTPTALDKENRWPVAEAALAAAKERTAGPAVAPMAACRALQSATGSNVEPGCDEKPQGRASQRALVPAVAVAPAAAAGRRTGSSAATAGAAPRGGGTTGSTPRCGAGTNASRAGADAGVSTPRAGRGPGTPRAGGFSTPRRGGGPAASRPGAMRRGSDPWVEVRAAVAQADSKEAENTALDEEQEAAEAAAQEAEAKAEQAEQELTAGSAAVLAEYAVEHEKCVALEAQLADKRRSLDAQRVENLGLSRQSLELDKQARSGSEQISKAEALLEKCSRSHGELDAELEERREGCEREREAARRQAGQAEADLQRFAKLRARLLEVQDVATSHGEAVALLAEADGFIAAARGAWEECHQVEREGVRPASPAPVAVANGGCTSAGGEEATTLATALPSMAVVAPVGPPMEPEAEPPRRSTGAEEAAGGGGPPATGPTPFAAPSVAAQVALEPADAAAGGPQAPAASSLPAQPWLAHKEGQQEPSLSVLGGGDNSHWGEACFEV